MEIKNFVKLASAALVVGSFASCQDYEPFDEATVAASVKAREFTDNFVQEFGNMAENHQWGFDLAEIAMGLRSNITRAQYKQDMDVEAFGWQKVTAIYGKPKNITQHEHDEVYAWFTNHKVTWVTTPTEYTGTSTRDVVNGTAYVINSSYPNYGSLKDYSSNVLGDYTIGEYVHFHNGWIQHVAENKNPEIVQFTMPNGQPLYMDASSNFYYESASGVFTRVDSYAQVVTDGSGNPITSDGTGLSLYQDTMDKGSHMDYLYTWGLTADGTGAWTEHILDFNSASGYGWGNQTTLNGTLVTDADINTWSFSSSTGSALKHDKYFLVYLKGDDYEGYYLGFDYESWGAENNTRIAADGICNDWIIKVGDAGSNQFNPARIMCEDLGGSFDTDYNDIVYDLTYENSILTITVQAAGGTLPIELYYGEKGKGGTLLKKGEVSEMHELFNAKLSEPVNVNAPNGVSRTPIVFKLKFNTSNTTDTYYNGSENVRYDYYSSDERFDLQKVNIYVYHEELADWVTIGNIDGAAPYKICVPGTLKWPFENQHIDWAYPSFKEWVANPTNLFWADGKTINNDYLY